MASKKRKSNSSRPRKLTRAQAAAKARRDAAKRRRRMLVVGAIAVLLAGLAIFFSVNGDDKTDVDAGNTTTTRSPDSVAGKPCVAMQGPAPAGAPEVPIPEGKPPTKLVKTDLKPGTGAEVGATDALKVNYIGVSCSSGKIFDSSYANGQPAEFSLTQVIKGWQEGIAGMKVGGQRLLGIPPKLAYGSTPPPGATDIKPDETLWFVVEVLEATPA